MKFEKSFFKKVRKVEECIKYFNQTVKKNTLSIFNFHLNKEQLDV